MLDNLQESKVFPYEWINLINPSQDKILEVSKKTKVPIEFFKYTLDSEETSHLDIVEEFVMIILDIPIGQINENTLVYDTYPIGIIYDEYCSYCLSKRNKNY